MSDKKNLLGDLKIERQNAPPPKRRGVFGWAIATVLAVALSLLAYQHFAESTISVEVATAQAQRGDASSANNGPSVLDASGYVVARRQATVSSKLTGKVTEVLIEEGMQVADGQILARIDDATPRAQLNLAEAQHAAARAGLAEVEAQLNEARRQLQRNEELAAQELVSASVLDSARANVDTLSARLARAGKDVEVAQRNVDLARRQVEDSVIRAPFAGIVTVKAAQPGEMISPVSAGGGFTRTGIGTIVDMASLEIEVDVNENFINRVRPGQPVSARLNAYPDDAIKAEVIAIVPTADRQKATVKVRIGFVEADTRVLPEMGARVSFLEEASEQAPTTRKSGVLIPAAAVMQDGNQNIVYLISGERAQRQAVQLGNQRGNQVEVLAGISAGQQVAISALAALADGSKVAVAAQ